MFSILLNRSNKVDFCPHKVERMKATIVCYCSCSRTRWFLLVHTHTHTCKPFKPWTMIFYSLNKDVHVRRILPANVGHLMCKTADTQLVYDFSVLNRGPNPEHVIFNIPLCARVGNLQPFAHIHKSWTVLICNVVLGLNVECRSMSSVDGAYKLTHTHTKSRQTQRHLHM